ncbi:GSU2403 family nucleotidyltransferase fold protein [Bradyrhizobium sp. USDA 3364]
MERIAHQQEVRQDKRERRALVSTLVRSFSFRRPVPEIGDVIAALAKAGVFRLRGVLVGTIPCQTYAAMLGVRLPVGSLQTGDVDIAQLKNVSVAVEDSTPPVLEVLKEVDKSFRAVPHTADGRRVTSYVAKGCLRVDFLTPHQGKETDRPQKLLP